MVCYYTYTQFRGYTRVFRYSTQVNTCCVNHSRIVTSGTSSQFTKWLPEFLQQGRYRANRGMKSEGIEFSQDDIREHHFCVTQVNIVHTRRVDTTKREPVSVHLPSLSGTFKDSSHTDVSSNSLRIKHSFYPPFEPHFANDNSYRLVTTTDRCLVIATQPNDHHF